jgi:hypothetical protein
MEIPKPSEEDKQFFRSLVPDDPAETGQGIRRIVSRGNSGARMIDSLLIR